MTTPAIPIQLSKRFYQSGSQWIKMDVSEQFGKVGIFFTYNGFIAILEKMAMSAVAAVIVNRIAG